MANRLYNKQVSVKGYSTGGRIEKVPGGYSKEGSGRISDKGLKGRSPTEAFKQKEMFKGSSKGMRVKKKEGGKIMEAAKAAAKRAKDKRASDRMKNSKPSKKFGSSTIDIFKSYGKYDGKPIELKEGGRTKKMTESQKQAAKDAPKKIKSFVKGFLKRSPLNVKGAIEGYAGLAKDIKNRMGKKMGGSLKPVPADNKGLKKLPTQVRNKMGFMKKGGKVK